MNTHQNNPIGHLRIILIKMSDKFYFGMAIFWTILTFYLSLISARSASKFNIWDFTGTDKLAHLIFYGVFSFLWCMSLRKRNVEKKYVLFFSIFFGVSMEIFQLYLFNGRSFELYDILANIIGSIIGVILFQKFIN